MPAVDRSLSKTANPVKEVLHRVILLISKPCLNLIVLLHKGRRFYWNIGDIRDIWDIVDMEIVEG